MHYLLPLLFFISLFRLKSDSSYSVNSALSSTMNSSNEPVESLSSSLLSSLSFNEMPSGSEDVLLERLLLSEEWLLLLSLSIMFSTKSKIMNCYYLYEYRIFKGHNKIYHRIFTGYLRGIKIHHNLFIQGVHVSKLSKFTTTFFMVSKLLQDTNNRNHYYIQNELKVYQTYQ